MMFLRVGYKCDSQATSKARIICANIGHPHRDVKHQRMNPEKEPRTNETS